jgi:hypothetical protein
LARETSFWGLKGGVFLQEGLHCACKLVFLLWNDKARLYAYKLSYRHALLGHREETWGEVSLIR